MAHVSRGTFVDSLANALDVDAIKVSVDDGTLGVWGNAKQTWQMIDKKSDYGIVLQDDAILCNNFKHKAKQFLIEHQPQICSFYFGQQNKTKYIKPHYFDAPLFHAVALAIPTNMIDDMISYCDKRTEVFGDDMKMKRWLISQNKLCRYSNPSYVQHRNIVSTIDPTKQTRQSDIFKQ